MTRLFCILAAAMLLTTPAIADDAGTTSPFNFGAGSRQLALGGAAMAVAEDATAPFWNPAGLARTERLSFAGLYVRLYESDVAYQYVGLALPTLDFGTFGIGVFRLGVDGIEKRDNNNFVVGEVEDSRLAFYLAYGRMISGNRIGLALTMEHHSLDDYSNTSSPGLNLAVQRDINLNTSRFRTLSLAAQFRNVIQPGIKLIEETVSYPTAAEIGASLGITPNPAWNHRATLSLKMVKTDQVDPRFSVGLEYGFDEFLHLRGGMRNGQASVGGGIRYKAITFDYALVERDLGSLHLFTLSTAVGTGVTQKRRLKEQQREAEFNNLMSDRLLAGKREMIGSLMAAGRELRDTGDLSGAVDNLDRALFMARSINDDTLAIATEYREARDRLDEVERKLRFGHNLDSAEVRFAAGDYLASQYFANLALSDEPSSIDAARLLAEADKALEANSSQVDWVSRQLALADSLLIGGRSGQAKVIMTELVEAYPENELIRMTYKRTAFELLRTRTGDAFARSEWSTVAAGLDSAATLFPDHQWCADMRRRLARATAVPEVDASQPKPQSVRKELSAELRREADKDYKTAMNLFKTGALVEAIGYWERVERLAPDYKSVREYLVNAYKFVGVEEYGRGNMQEAVEVWEKALALDPGNDEIVGYLKRTRTEIIKLREFSYDEQ